MSDQIPWDKIVAKYDHQFTSRAGRPPISGRVVIGAMIINLINRIVNADNISHAQIICN